MFVCTCQNSKRASFRSVASLFHANRIDQHARHRASGAHFPFHARRAAKTRTHTDIYFLSLSAVAHLAGSLALPILAVLTTPEAVTSSAVFSSIAVVVAMSAAFYRLLRILEEGLQEESRGQAAFLESIATRFIPLAIVGSAALSLFVELAVIRWQGTVFEFFAFYKNYGLLACFAGLGLGYALSRSEEGIPLALTIPLLGWQFLLLIGLRYGLPDRVLSMNGIPFREQFNMGMNAGPQKFGVIYLLLTVVFLLTALAFLPVGQLCGKLMERTGQLSAYG